MSNLLCICWDHASYILKVMVRSFDLILIAVLTKNNQKDVSFVIWVGVIFLRHNKINSNFLVQKDGD